MSGHFLADVFGSNEGRCALEPTSSHARAKRLCLIGLLVSQGKSDNDNTDRGSGFLQRVNCYPFFFAVHVYKFFFCAR